MADIVVITEGTAGVGRAFARKYARSGAKIAVLARGLDELRETAVELVTCGATAALAIPCDVTDPEMVARATQRIVEELGPIDVWIDGEPRAKRPAVRGRPLRIGLIAGGAALAAGAIAFAIVKLARR